MRAAILRTAGGPPEVGEFGGPDGDDVVTVSVAGANPVDILLASDDPTLPSVVGQEGVGRNAGGDRVYFNSPRDPHGSWAERCRVDPDRCFPVPDGVDDDLAVTLGIAGLAAWLPLTRHSEPRDADLLVLGATGVVGQIAVQAAKLLGARRVVAAGRDEDALRRVSQLGADATVVLGDDDAAALRAETRDGYDVVIDTVYGDPFLAALDATADGATLVTIGLSAGDTAEIPFFALQGRTHVGHGNNAMAIDVVRDAYAELLGHAARGEIQIEIERYALERATDAWRAQEEGPHHKIVVVP